MLREKIPFKQQGFTIWLNLERYVKKGRSLFEQIHKSEIDIS